MKRLLSHTISHEATTIARYSASADNRETVCCFLDFQDINEPPRKTQNPVIDLLVSTHEPQSASAQGWIEKSGTLDRKNLPAVPLM